MNRDREYKDLMAELADTPKGLELTVNHALKRKKTSHQNRRAFEIRIGSLWEDSGIEKIGRGGQLVSVTDGCSGK